MRKNSGPEDDPAASTMYFGWYSRKLDKRDFERSKAHHDRVRHRAMIHAAKRGRSLDRNYSNASQIYVREFNQALMSDEQRMEARIIGLVQRFKQRTAMKRPRRPKPTAPSVLMRA